MSEGHGRPQEFFQEVGPTKSVKGAPIIFFRQALKFASRGGEGAVLMPAEFFSMSPQVY